MIKKNLYTIIKGTGSYIPQKKILNENFLENKFYTEIGDDVVYADGPKKGEIKPNEVIIQKFQEITGIKERRYVKDGQTNSDIAYLAGKNCLESSEVRPEDLNYILVAHNFGDMESKGGRMDQLPGIAAKVKEKLNLRNNKTEVMDVPFGCPGWLQGMVHMDRMLGENEKALIIGSETLSKIADPHDIDSMIYSDGAGATLVQKERRDYMEAREYFPPRGILSYSIDCGDSSCTNVMRMGKSNNSSLEGLFFKMDGREVYKYAGTNVPKVIWESIFKANLELKDIKKILLHQANEKMDESIIKNLFKLYGLRPSKEEIGEIMPMTISWLGNNSVATIPILFDLLLKEKIEGHKIESGDNIVFASVGAGGPNINSVVYRMP